MIKATTDSARKTSLKSWRTAINKDSILFFLNNGSRHWWILLLSYILSLIFFHTQVNSFVLPLFDYGDVIWGDRGNATLMAELQVLHNKAARIILDLPLRASASDALAKLRWKSLQRRRAEHRAIFMYKSINNLFAYKFQCSFSRDFHSYNTRFKNNVRKSTASRRWGHWSSINFAADVWNSLELSLGKRPHWLLLSVVF